MNVAVQEPKFWEKVNKHGPVPEHCPELGPCWIWTAGLVSALPISVLSKKYGVCHHTVWVLLRGKSWKGVQ